ncbi:unnamed protein product [Caenorhabditis nigoni]
MNNGLGPNQPRNLEKEEEPHNQFYPQEGHQHQMQQDPQNDIFHHNQFYPETLREQNQLNNLNNGQQVLHNGRVDQQRHNQRNHQNNHVQQQQNDQPMIHQDLPLRQPQHQLPNNGRVDQQRDHQDNYGQQQRNRYHQLHPHFKNHS